ncbi:hypothetical protein CL633_01320 [bacterium]|nr:hypothetical protein [bacterium]|tara:strand:+ start:8196 stop:8519 length:324 start_codon:yes stop_codon:yes gene_type:complete
MLHLKPNKKSPKAWFCGPWNCGLKIAIGYANQGISEKHYHKKIHEIYLVAKGTSTAMVNKKKIQLKAGDILVVEPNEIHTFIKNSSDYFHFVVHSPCVKKDKIIVKK